MEKYRPTKWSEWKGEEDLKNEIIQLTKQKDRPHLIFYGPSGSGKNSLLQLLLKEMDVEIKEMNASQDRGIEVIRNVVQAFCTIETKKKSKVFVMDEADGMTKVEQFALRRVLEVHSDVVQFVFLVNSVTKLIDAIRSRCREFAFPKLSIDVVHECLSDIVEKEKIKIHKEKQTQLIGMISEAADGDMRKAIQWLHALHSTTEDEINVEDVEECLARIPDAFIQHIIQEMKTIEHLQMVVDQILCEGYSANQCILQVVPYLVNKKKVTSKKMSTILLAAAQADAHLAKGGDEELQLLRFLKTLL